MANKKPDEAAKIAVVKSKFKVCLCTDSSSAKIYRPNMPYIIDNKEAAVRWLAEKGFKAEEIEVVGEKPVNWDTVFPPHGVPETVPVAEVLAGVLNGPPPVEVF